MTAAASLSTAAQSVALRQRADEAGRPLAAAEYTSIPVRRGSARGQFRCMALLLPEVQIL